MVEQYGRTTVAAYMGHVQDNAEESVRRVVTALKDGEFSLALDNGAVIRVAVRVDAAARSAEIDFSGTSAQLSNNFNAPKAVTMAAVLYVFRTLVDDDIPLNAGCLKLLGSCALVPLKSMVASRAAACTVTFTQICAPLSRARVNWPSFSAVMTRRTDSSALSCTCFM